MGAEDDEVRAHRDQVERWRADRIARLTGPDGWLSVVGLAWLREGVNTVGSEPSSNVVLPAGPGRAGSIVVQGGRAAFVAEPGSGVATDGSAVGAGPLSLRDDVDDDPTVLRLG